MIAHIVFGNLSYDQRVKKEVDALRNNNYKIIVIAKNNADKNIKTNNYIKFLFLTLIWLLKQKPKVVHAHDWYGLLPAFLYSIFRNIFLIYDAHELYYNRTLQLREKIIVIIEKISLKKVNKIICANNYRARIFKLIHKKDDISIISNSYFSNKTYKHIEDVDQINVVYMGSMSKARNVELWIKSLLNLEYVILHLIGTGPDYMYFKDEYESSNVIFYGNMTHLEMKKIMDQMHLGIITYNKKGLNNYYCEPNKVGEYAYFGLPFISNYNYTLNIIEKKYQIGYTLSEINSKSIEDVINKMKSNFQFLQNNLNVFKTQNNWSIEKYKLLELYGKIGHL